jgi:hypothetical protein
MASQLLDLYSPNTVETQTPKHLSHFYSGLMRAPTSLARYEVKSLVEAEVRAEPQERRRLVLTRLRAWLALDPETAKEIAVLHEEALAKLPDEARVLIVETERDAALHALTYDEFVRLKQALPRFETWALPKEDDPRRLDTLTALALAFETELAYA